MTQLRDLTQEQVAIIKARIKRGDKYSEIAADYRLNQGRIADIKFERAFSEISPAELNS